MSDVLISVENLSKKFCIDLKTSLWYGLGDMFMELTGKLETNNNGLRKKEFWAVNDINFEVKRGECLGLIGRNGAGKSTLLKMLNGLLKPDKGRIEMHGRVGALIELGAGFNPILTGRENIYVNGAVLGFAKKEIDRKFDSIVDFSEIGDFLDTPVQNYSSGMKVRLGFAVAINMEPDVLLIDEVLAVGDSGFKIKCYNEIYKILDKAAVILVSHSMPQVGKICTNGILLDKGVILKSSSQISEVINNYYGLFKTGALSIEGSDKAKFISLSFGNPDNLINIENADLFSEKPVEYFLGIDNSVEIQLTVEIHNDVDEFNVIFFFVDIDQKIVSQTMFPEAPFLNLHHRQTITLHFNDLMLNSGHYSICFQIYNKSVTDRGEVILGLRNIIYFTVKRDIYHGAAPIVYNNEWQNYIG
jgi:lipopolysaccharide transport system ATP-binding protein